MEIQVDVRKAVWSRYWSHGIAHSCGGSYGNRYEGSLARFWRAVAGDLPAGARVLDIATGNGAVPQLLLDGADSPIACDAIDLAQPDPQWLAGLPEHKRRQLRFHGQQVAEALPFPDTHFDLVTSQYGLEYTDLQRSLPEILRVLRPGGKVRLVTHHVDARPVRLARAELDNLDWMMAPDGLLDTGRAMLAPMARAATEAGLAALAGDPGANAVRARFNLLQNEATRLAAASACPDVLGDTRIDLGGILNLALAHGAAVADEAFGRMLRDLDDSRVRLQELVDYALDETGAQALAAALARGGRQEVDTLFDEGILMGWSIAADPL
jgi:SAM-dependent methyltransferase